MDMCMADATGLGAAPGDEVELFGEHLPVEDAAALAGTIQYELLCAVSPRVPREYLNCASAHTAAPPGIQWFGEGCRRSGGERRGLPVF